MQAIQDTPAMKLCEALEAIEAGNTEPTESHANEPFIKPFCFMCRYEPHCPTCLLQGERIMLSSDQQSDLYDAVYRQKAGAYTYPQQRLSFTKQQLADVMEEFRVLLREYTPWYDNTSRRMIEACYQKLCISGGTSNKVAIAIHFFEGEFARASEVDA
jgi:hypothetical protein